MMTAILNLVRLPPSLLGLPPRTGGGAARWANGPAWAGYHWDFVFKDGARLTFNGEPIVTQVRN